MRRTKTGIRNMDKLLGGGIPEKELILIKGEPGTGKSNMGLEYLYRGAKKGEKGLFISFQDTKDEVLRTTTFDWEFESEVEKGNIAIRKFDPYRSTQVSSMIRDAVKENDSERVVIDPITDLDIYIDSRKDMRKNLLSIKRELQPVGATTLLIAEKSEATKIEEEVSGGIIELEMVRRNGKLERDIMVRKLKGSDYNHGVHKYSIDNHGIEIR